MTAHFRLPWSFPDFRSFWDDGLSLLSANARTPLDGETDRAADAYFHHALLTYPLDDALLSSVASFSCLPATRAFDFAGADSLAQIVGAPRWGSADVAASADPLDTIAANIVGADLIWSPGGGAPGPVHPVDWFSFSRDPVFGSGAQVDQPAAFDSGWSVGPSGGGADVLTSDAGRDALDFGPPNDLVRGMVDYSRADYCLQLDHALMPQLGALGALAQEAFHIGSAAADASDRIIYNSATGALYYDPDGAGSAAQVHIANLSPGLSLTAATFVII